MNPTIANFLKNAIYGATIGVTALMIVIIYHIEAGTENPSGFELFVPAMGLIIAINLVIAYLERAAEGEDE